MSAAPIAGPTAELLIRFEGWVKRVPLGSEPVVLGRSSECDVTLPDPALSRQHCRIAPNGEGWTLEDLGSRAGTFIDGARTETSAPLEPSSRVQDRLDFGPASAHAERRALRRFVARRTQRRAPAQDPRRAAGRRRLRRAPADHSGPRDSGGRRGARRTVVGRTRRQARSRTGSGRLGTRPRARGGPEPLAPGPGAAEPQRRATDRFRGSGAAGGSAPQRGGQRASQCALRADAGAGTQRRSALHRQQPARGRLRAGRSRHARGARRPRRAGHRTLETARGSAAPRSRGTRAPGAGERHSAQPAGSCRRRSAKARPCGMSSMWSAASPRPTPRSA